MRTLRLAPVLVTAALSTVLAAALLPPQDVEVAKPTDNHKAIFHTVGKYEGTMWMWMPGMEQPMEAPCEEVITGIGELWTTSRFEMDMMGGRFVGSSTFGYDTENKEFIGTWIDSTSTSLTIMKGDWNAEKTAIVMQYEGPDPMTGAMGMNHNEMTLNDEGYVLDFYHTSDEGRRKTMSMDMKRVDS